jgi:hypothetical protein
MKGHTGRSALCQILPCSYRSRLWKYNSTLESACCCVTDSNEGGLALGQAYRKRFGVYFQAIAILSDINALAHEYW